MRDLPSSFHPVIREWFAQTYGAPTAVQAEAWPAIERGENVLALAPTGSGKTLTAFMSAISRFCAGGEGGAGAYPADRLAALYVSPLKALNEDIKRNLLQPLAAIRERFAKAGLEFPEIRVETRSGDTPQSERRRFLLRPPSILALTPESLAILLLNPKGRQALSTVRYLILDEIHAVLASKRGSFLSCQIDRLAAVAGEFQRISLSATVRPPQAAAAFVAGLAPGGKPRPIRIVAPDDPRDKRIEIGIDYRSGASGEDDDGEDAGRQITYGRRYGALVGYILSKIRANSTLLVFTDSRRRAERISFCVNEEAARIGAGREVCFAHHGSLSKDLRRSVERRLAEGQLPCVVATASLELGIDIGSVDEVVLAGSPGSVAQALQRIGRSGHSVGRTSRGRLFPFHGMDLLAAAALAGAVEERDIEEARPIENPLDILAQIILALCAERAWHADELYATLRGFYVFRSLNRDSFDRVMRMLAGCGSGGRLRELKPRIRLDSATGEASALDGNLLLLYSSGGVIANRGLYSMRLAGTQEGAPGAKIGELDEEFVWERRVGDRFSFGGKGWQIAGIGAEAVEVVALGAPDEFMPFWRADAYFRSARIAKGILAILDRHASADPDSAPPRDDGSSEYALARFLDSQLEAQGGAPLSGSANITVEIIDSLENGGDFYTAVVHSFRGGAVNYPLSLALSGELEDALQIRVETFSNDDAMLFLLPRHTLAGGEREAGAMFRRAFAALGEPEGASGMSRGERAFRNRLEASGVFGASFREAAERSLLLPKAGFGRRTPLWIMRQRSKRLFDAVSREGDFPVTAEAWRSCLVDTFDMEGFRDLVAAVREGSVALSFFASSAPSPFSREVVWRETNTLLYEGDEQAGAATGGGGGATLSDKVIQDALGDAALRPALKPDLVASFAARLRREAPGWAPEGAPALCDWVKERIAIPLDEWEALLASMPEGARADAEDPYIRARVRTVALEGAGVASVVHRDWEEAWGKEALALLGPWLRYQGPVSASRIAEVFGSSAERALGAAGALAEVGEAVLDVALESADGAREPEALVCDRENLEMLLRLSRRKARPEIRERPAGALVPFLALRQGFGGAGGEGVPFAGDAGFLKKLRGYAAPARLWEREFFAARRSDYSAEALDREMREGRVVWYGAGKERVGFCPVEDLEIALPDAAPAPAPKRAAGGEGAQAVSGALAEAAGAGFFDRPRDFWEIKDKAAGMVARDRGAGDAGANVGNKDCARAIWQGAWQGLLSADSFDPVRAGLERGFAPKEGDGADAPALAPPAAAPFAPRAPSIPRALRNRWKEGAPVAGAWYSLALESPGGRDGAGDPLDEERRNRDRVRLLLARWGVLCRALFENESAPFSWSALLPAMRRMELAGELVAGRFFAGANSLQFASPSIAAELERADAFDGVYWMNAADPASPAGLGVEGLDPRIPARLPTSRLYFRGARLLASSRKNGRDLRIHVEPDDPILGELVALFKAPRLRKAFPESKLVVEEINGAAAAPGEYAPAFRAAGFEADRGKLRFW